MPNDAERIRNVVDLWQELWDKVCIDEYGTTVPLGPVLHMEDEE